MHDHPNTACPTKKECDDETNLMMRQIFNEIIKQKECTLQTWQLIRIKLIFKKGDVEDASNYRPICTLPAPYKLFATLSYTRLCPRFDSRQPPNQGGFRRSHQTVDHLTVYRWLEQRCQEWRIPLCICTIDFTKAFDRIKHEYLWKSLEH